MTNTANQASTTSEDKSLEDKAAQLVEIINSSKSKEQKQDEIWEILKNV